MPRSRFHNHDRRRDEVSQHDDDRGAWQVCPTEGAPQPVHTLPFVLTFIPWSASPGDLSGELGAGRARQEVKPDNFSNDAASFTLHPATNVARARTKAFSAAGASAVAASMPPPPKRPSRISLVRGTGPHPAHLKYSMSRVPVADIARKLASTAAPETLTQAPVASG